MRKRIAQKEKIKVGLVQINNSFANQNYFPYSLGFLQAYAQKYLKNIGEFEFLTPLYKRIPADAAVKTLLEADIFFFSTYVWNFKISSLIAREVKKNKPEAIIVFGGCQVPKGNIDNFMNDNPFIDIACYGEGERVFNSILENCREGAWERVPSIAYLEEGEIVRNRQCARISDLSEIPSPYLSGVFDNLMKENPQEVWLGLWETNRGCPFHCSYCEWGGDYHKKIYVHDLEKLSEEVDWFSRNKIEFIFCCDANFGVLKRDLQIVERVAENKARYGYPKALSVQNTKNSAEFSYRIQKVLAQSGLSKGVNLAFQSLNEKTLKAVGRQNALFKTFRTLQKKFNFEGIETFSDIILGLPLETYETFVNGISFLIENGQHNRIQFNNLSLLPNSEMADPEYQKRYGFIAVDTKLINIHGSLADGGVSESQRLVVGTDTMPPGDWVKARVFGWLVSLLYFDKLLQIPLDIIRNIYSLSYRELFEAFLRPDSSAPIWQKVNDSFKDKAEGIQKGDAEFCQSKQWLNIWWPADELMFIELCTEDKLDDFYAESRQIIENFLKQKNINYDGELIAQSISLNRSLLKMPLQDTNLNIKTDYNIWELYRSCLKGEVVSVNKRGYAYLIDRESEKWGSWEEWCQKVVWYGNKKGAYLYSIK